MRFPRSCGTLVHPTSFPGKYGIGDFGYEARAFIDFLERTNQTIWQVLPLRQLDMVIHHMQVILLLQVTPI